MKLKQHIVSKYRHEHMVFMFKVYMLHVLPIEY